MDTSLPDADPPDTENAGQWTLLPSYEWAQHLTLGVRRAWKRERSGRCKASPARRGSAGTPLRLGADPWLFSLFDGSRPLTVFLGQPIGSPRPQRQAGMEATSSRGSGPS